jgi:hypothetical protein
VLRRPTPTAGREGAPDPRRSGGLHGPGPAVVRLGAACTYDLGAVPVVVLAVDDKTSKAEVFTLPPEDCTPLRLEADSASVAARPPKITGSGPGSAGG